MSDLHALNLEAGQLVGGYTLLSRLGGGAMGSVWRVTDGGGQVYAMKILRDSLADDEASATDRLTARERLRREAVALQKVRHSGVCSIVDMELDDSLAFIVTELIEGKNLRDDVAANGRYVGDDLERLARKLIDAVRAVHAAGIIHRDIKPTNVMVAASGPVLVDFGIAMGEGESHVTRTGLVMGTPGFIAPEIIDGAESDEWTDWWSVASVLAFAATGQPVFGVKPMMAVLERAASGNAMLQGLPARTMAAFRAALMPDRAQRCTPDELLEAISMDALQAFSGGSDGNDASSEMMPPFSDSVTMPLAGGIPTVQPDTLAGATGLPGTTAMAASVDNPRTLWRDDDSVTSTAAPATQMTIPTTPQMTQVLSGSGTRLMPQAGEATLPMTDATTTLPLTGGQPTAQPAMQYPLQPLSQPLAFEQTNPFAESPQQPATALNPAEETRYRRRSHGRWAALTLAVPVSLLGACMPLWTVVLCAGAAWLFATIGINAMAQLDRESRRGGMRKRSDQALRIAALPWHMCKALPGALATALLASLVAMVVLLACMMVTSLPTATLRLWGMDVVLPSDTSLSATGATLALSWALGWLVAACTPAAGPIRFGLGVLCAGRTTVRLVTNSTDDANDIESMQTDPAQVLSQPQSARRRALFAAAAWAIVTTACATVVLADEPLTWSPLSTASFISIDYYGQH